MKLLAARSGPAGYWTVFIPELDVSCVARIRADIKPTAAAFIEIVTGRAISADELTVKALSYSELYFYEIGRKSYAERGID